MNSALEWIFPPFRLDIANARLWRDEQALPLRPKTLAVLHFLVTHPDRLIGKAELLDAVWGHRHVSESVLEGCISELRRALNDDPKAPRYVETVVRRGYRFVATPQSAGSTAPPGRPGHAPLAAADAEQWVRREALLAQLLELWQGSRLGERHMVFLTGEAGLGKTTLIEMFLRQPELEGAQVLWGQCVDSYGAGEAFLPLLTALQQLGHSIAELLRLHAPTWLVQMPSLLSADQRHSLNIEVLGATRERLVREGCDLLEALAATAPLVLILEDLHWSDLATLDLLSALGRRRGRSALLAIGSYRPSDALLRDHPLGKMQGELQTQRLCTELPLTAFSYTELCAYLERRLSEGRLSEAAAQGIHRRTGGHPLFVVNLIDSLLAEGLLRNDSGEWRLTDAEHGVPGDTQRIIEHQAARLDAEDQKLLEAASAAGMESSAALLAAALEEDTLEIETRCSRLARQGPMLAETGTVEWPDGTLAGAYAFRHALYAEVLYRRLSPAYRMALHRRLGERLEAAYGARAGEIAAELARHFGEGRDYPKAVHYLRLAAAHAAASFANQEALDYLGRALSWVDRLPAETRADTHIATLQQRAFVYRSFGNWPIASADLEAVIALARAEDRREEEIQSLIALAEVLMIFDRARCLPTIEQAVERSRPLADERPRVYAEAQLADFHFSFLEWSEIYRPALIRREELARRYGDDRILALHLANASLNGYTDYTATLAAARELTQLALKMADGFLQLMGHICSSWALLNLGRWAELQLTLSEGLSSAEKNVNPSAYAVFLSIGGALHLEAQDFSGALALCENAPPWSGDTYSLDLDRLMRGAAYLGLGQFGEAAHWLGQIAGPLETGALVDVPSQMALRLCLGVCHLAQGQPAQTRVEMERLFALAAPRSAWHFLALGHCLLAQLAAVEEQAVEAESEIAQALALIDGKVLPLAAWKVHATAAEIRLAAGQENQAREHRDKAAEITHALANSLNQTPDGSRLRRSFLDAPAIRKLLTSGSQPLLPS